MQADLPFYESPEDALRAAMQHLGGAKVVGAKIWPEKSPDAAGRLLQDSLNPARAEKLDIGQVMLLLRMARDVGFHAPMLWIAGDVGYDAKPVTRAHEADRLALVVEQSTKTLSSALAALERLQAGRVLA